MREYILATVADPNIGFIILLVGIVAIYVEFCMPGRVVPGVCGGILALLGLRSLTEAPISWLGAFLLAVGVSLFAVGAKFGLRVIAGAGGTIAIVLGATSMRIHPSIALAATIPFAAITMFLLTVAIRAKANKAA